MICKRILILVNLIFQRYYLRFYGMFNALTFELIPSVLNTMKTGLEQGIIGYLGRQTIRRIEIALA
jgi:hypothetical protein